MVNFKTLNNNVLVSVEKKEKQTESGIIIPDTVETKLVSGNVVDSNGGREDLLNKNVYFLRENSYEITIDGKNYFLVKEENLLGFKN